jgi:hypothetical protein
MSTKRECAHRCARRGFDVFPIVPNAKKPLIENWQNLATRDPAQIDRWWSEWPDANIGWPTNEYIVIDVDPRKGGAETFLTLLDMYDMPKTTRHGTQGGGDHIIFAAPDRKPVKGGNDKLGQGIDIKARGGFILLPGSTIDGRPYTVGNTREIALAPPWLVAACPLGRQKNDAAGQRIVEEDDLARELFEQWMLKHAPSAETGNIDNTTYKVAARGYDFACSTATVLDVMLEWNETKCFPPQEMEDLERVVESAGRNRENAIGSAHPLRPGFDPIEIDETKAPAMASAEPTPSKPADGMVLERYFAAAAKALSSQAEPLVKGILDRNAMSILYGESNTGKTFIAVDLAFHVAAGLAWARRKVRKGAVVYVAAEGGTGVYKRLAALRENYPDTGDIPLFIIKFPVDLLHGKVHAQALVKLCLQAAEEAGCTMELIVIDTLSRAMSGGDENSSTDMGAMVQSFDAIREATGAHLMVIHHSGKDRAKGARGHSLLRAATDTEIEIERGKLAVTKQRDMDGDFSHAFDLKTVPIGLDADGAVVSSCVVELIAHHKAGEGKVALTPGEQALVEAIKQRLGADTKTVFGWEFVRLARLEFGLELGNSAQAINTSLSNLVEKGHVKKYKRGQYVMG